MTLEERLDALHATWFPADLDSAAAVAERTAVWFGGPSDLDDRLRDEFGDLPDLVAAREPGAWGDEPSRAVAAVIALDQVPRNIHRGSPRAFAYDARAVEVAAALCDAGVVERLHPVEAQFVYLPFEHAESTELQARCVDGFRGLHARAPAGLEEQLEQAVGYALRHQTIIDRFGRFPHRNDVLGRATSDEERAWLDAGGDTFS